MDEACMFSLRVYDMLVPVELEPAFEPAFELAFELALNCLCRDRAHNMIARDQLHKGFARKPANSRTGKGRDRRTFQRPFGG